MKNVIEEKMHEYQPLYTIPNIAMDEFDSYEKPNCDDIAPAIQPGLDYLEQQTRESHSFAISTLAGLITKRL